MPPPFESPRNRDAYAAIRGFVYQVNLTLLRWFGLTQGQHLELECGEDIDLVTKALSADDEEQSRLLVQVKRRDDAVTLRTSAALEAIANAVEHRTANPDATLRFMYLTNAFIGRERPQLFRDGKPALLVWQDIQAGRLAGADAAEAVGALRRFLLAAARPSSVGARVWESLQMFLAAVDDDELAGFIRAFEWCTAQPDESALAATVERELMATGLAVSTEEAQQLHERLFAFVFTTLCQRGAKRLTKELLECECTRPTLAGSDHQVLKRLRERIAQYGVRLKAVEGSVQALAAQVAALARGQGMGNTVISAIGVVHLEPPPLSDRLSSRALPVKQICERLDRFTWVAVVGGADTGKSHLAVLTTRGFGSCRAWIRLHHEMSPADAIRALNASLFLAIKSDVKHGEGLQEVFKALGPRSLVVVDDLPRLLLNDPLSKHLVDIAALAKAEGVRLLSTSLSETSRPVRAILGEAFTEFANPPLSLSEAKEILAAHQAPADVLNGQPAQSLNNLASGHPLLLTLIAEFLSRRNWDLSGSAFTDLRAGQHTEGLSDDVMGQLVQSLEADRRELLYRLTLATDGFHREDVKPLAAVAPTVARSAECFQDLLGAWVQRDTPTTFIVSPLVRLVGPGALADDTKSSCNRVLGDCITGRPMSFLDAQRALSHYTAAAEHGRAGTLFLMLLQTAAEHENRPDLSLVASMWSSTTLPEGMDLGLRLLVRGMQVEVALKYSRGIEFLLGDADALFEQATDEHAWGVAGLALFAIKSLVAFGFSRAMRYLRAALSVRGPVRVPGARESVPASELGVDRLLWLLVIWVDSEETLFAWLEAFELLPEDRRRSLLATPEARTGCSALCDRLMWLQMERPREEREWEGVLSTLSKVRDWARSRRLPLLEACACRGLVYSYGEKFDLSGAVDAAQEALAAAPDNNLTRLLVAGAAARFLVKSKRFDDARPLLDRSIIVNVEGFEHERMLILLAASHAYGVSDPRMGVTLAEAAVELSKAFQDVTPIEAGRANMELAVARYLAEERAEEGMRAAFGPWMLAADLLFDSKSEEDHWKDTLVVFGHTTVFLAFVARGEHPPPSAHDGSSNPGPMRGLFLFTMPERVALYQAASEAGVMWLLATYAWAMGDADLTARWLKRAAATAGEKLTYFQAALGGELVPMMVLKNQIEDAVDFAVKAGVATQMHREASAKPLDPVKDILDLDVALASMSPEQRANAEDIGASLVLIPAFCRISFLITTQPDQAPPLQARLLSVCRQMTSASGYTTLWAHAADAMESAWADEPSALERYQRVKSVGAQGAASVQALAYLGCSFGDDVEFAFNAQIGTMEWIFRSFPPSTVTHQLILLPFLESFWMTTFRDKRFRFSSPRLVEEELNSAIRVTNERRAKAVLRAVSAGFAIRKGLEPAASWLRDDSP